MSTLVDTKFAVGDRVVVAAQCPLRNLVGRFGTVKGILLGSDVWNYEMMIDVTLDNLVTQPDVPFFLHEILKLDEKEDDA